MRKEGVANHIPCHYCGLPIDYYAPASSPLAFTADHVIPVAAGGSDRRENLVHAHNKCNRAKSDSLAMPVSVVRVSQVRHQW